MSFWRRLFGNNSNRNGTNNHYLLEFSGEMMPSEAMRIATIVERSGGSIGKFELKPRVGAEFGNRVTTLGR